MEFRLPKLSSTMETGKVGQWFKAVGDAVRMGEALVEIETDKAAMEVESPADGVVEAILAEAGTELAVGDVLVRLRVAGEASGTVARDAPPATAPASAPVTAPATIPAAPVTTPATAPATAPITAPITAPATAPATTRAAPVPAPVIAPATTPAAPATAPITAPVTAPATTPAAPATAPATATAPYPFAENMARPDPTPAPATARLLASPMARRLAGLHAVDLGRLQGSGPHGRIRKRDVLAVAGAGSEPGTVASGIFHPLSPMRAGIAASVSRSRQTVPAFVLDRWAETTGIAVARATLAQGDIALTFTDFLLLAMAEALAQAPNVFDLFAEQGGHPGRIRPAGVDIGLVVAVPDGVMIPVLRNLAGLGLSGIAQARHAAVQRARAGRLTQGDAAPVALSLSNIGKSGADRFEAIISPGQTGILAVGRDHLRVIPRAGGMAVASGVNLTLAVDHRLIDGVAGGQFLGTLAERLERGAWTLG